MGAPCRAASGGRMKALDLKSAITLLAALIALLMIPVLFGSCRKRMADPLMVPIARGYDASTVMTNRTGFLSPFLCAATETRLVCQATMDVTLRRGTHLTPLVRGATVWWDNPQGAGDAVVWFGCPTDAECEAQFHFVSDVVTVTPGDGVAAIKGDPLNVPPGAVGIVAVGVTNSQFVAAYDRWTGAWAPPLLRVGSGLELHCTAQSCTIMLTAPAAARTNLTITGTTTVTADAGTSISCIDGKCTVGETPAARKGR